MSPFSKTFRARQELTYHDLLLLSRRCAAKLQLLAESKRSPGEPGRGALAARLVALYLQPGPALVAAVLGTWLAKSAWTPLDRKSPALRIRELVKQATASFGVGLDSGIGGWL